MRIFVISIFFLMVSCSSGNGPILKEGKFKFDSSKFRIEFMSLIGERNNKPVFESNNQVCFILKKDSLELVKSFQDKKQEPQFINNNCLITFSTKSKSKFFIHYFNKKKKKKEVEINEKLRSGYPKLAATCTCDTLVYTTPDGELKFLNLSNGIKNSFSTKVKKGTYPIIKAGNLYYKNFYKKLISSEVSTTVDIYKYNFASNKKTKIVEKVLYARDFILSDSLIFATKSKEGKLKDYLINYKAGSEKCLGNRFLDSNMFVYDYFGGYKVGFVYDGVKFKKIDLNKL